VIVRDLHVVSAVVRPPKTDAVLVVDPDAVLPFRSPFNASRWVPGGNDVTEELPPTDASAERSGSPPGAVSTVDI